MTTETTNPKYHRWFRFRLRTLLIMVTVSAVTLGWVDWVCRELDQRQREKLTIEWVYQMGGGIKLHSRNDQRSWWKKTKGVLFGGRGRERVQVVRIRNVQLSDLSPLAELKNLQYLDLYDTTVSEEQVRELGLALPNCEIRR